MNAKTMEHKKMAYMIDKVDDPLRLETIKQDVLFDQSLSWTKLHDMLSYFETHVIHKKAIQVFYAISIRLMEAYYTAGNEGYFKRFVETVRSFEFEGTFAEKERLDFFLTYIQTEEGSLMTGLKINDLYQSFSEKPVSTIDVFLFKIIIYDLKCETNRVLLESQDFKTLEKCIVLLEKEALTQDLSDLLEYHVELFASYEGMASCEDFLRNMIFKTEVARPKKFYGDLQFSLGALYKIKDQRTADCKMVQKSKDAFTTALEYYGSIGHYKRHGVLTNALQGIHLRLGEYESLISLAIFSMTHFLDEGDSDKVKEWLGLVLSLLNRKTLECVDDVKKVLKMVFIVMTEYSSELNVSKICNELLGHCASYHLYDLEYALRNNRIMNMEKYDLAFENMHIEYQRIDQLKVLLNKQ